MSQKSSVPQAISFVSQVLKRDTCAYSIAMHAPKTHAHPVTKNLTGSIRIAISFAGRTPHRPALVLPVASISMCRLAL